MKNSGECSASQLLEVLDIEFDHFIVSASYEERAYAVWEVMHPRVLYGKWVCWNKNHISYLQESVGRFLSIAPSSNLIELDSDNPGSSFQSLLGMFAELGKEVYTIGVDITGFTKEALAMIVFLAKHCLKAESRLIMFYHRASKYGKSTSRGWLSQGVREIRTIVGYSGHMRPAFSSELLLIPGFEVERAQEIIDSIEPAHFSLGVLREEELVLRVNPHDDPLTEFTSRVRSLYAPSDVGWFYFSSVDPDYTRKALIEKASRERCNIIVSCLNSKLAMVGVCLAAIENKAIQVVYAQPLYYNVLDYSEPSGRIVYFELF